MREWGYEYFDGEFGYGGYYYDGRWKPVAEEMISHYELISGSSVLDVGCAKGYLMYEFYKLGIKNVFGCDISSYAIARVPREIAGNFKVMSAEVLDYEDSQFDLVVSIDCIHNLDSERVDKAITEMMRVSKKDVFIRVCSYQTQEQLDNLRKWGGATILTYGSAEEWLARFKRLHYEGDWYFKLTEVLE
jgi:protein-L-isoaspartate(D-aspartate) O-methyltransferase